MTFLYSFIRRKYYRLLEAKRHQYLTNLINKGLIVGNNVKIVDTFFLDPSHCFLISIGDNCTICPNVRLIAHDASTKQFLGYAKIGKITIHANCFIGDSVIILPNVSIGPNAIVGAGSIVTKDIPPGVVAVGNPARPRTSLDEYLTKISEKSASTKIFGKEYHIGNLTAERRKEVLETMTYSVGFIE